MFSFLPPSIPRSILLCVTAVLFILIGVRHFTNPEFFVAIVPPYLPAPYALVYISGLAEILGGIGVLIPATRKWAGYGLLALLVAVYPANIHMAMNPDQFPDMSVQALLIRLPFQFLFAAMVWWSACSAGSQSVPAPAAAE